MAYGQQSSGLVGGADAAQPAAAHLAQVNKSLAESVGALQDLGQRLHLVADRVLGSRPQGVDKASAPNAPDSSMLQAFSRNQDALIAVISYIRDGVHRIEDL